MSGARLRVQGGARLQGSLRVPSDKSIGHRALMFGALAQGRSEIDAYHGALDHEATRQAFMAMGVEVEVQRDLEATRLVVHGQGPHGLRAPLAALDCGNSGTTMRLLAGLLSAQPFASTLHGDASLSRRPMGRIVKPLRARGARIEARREAGSEAWYSPLHIGPLPADMRLRGIEYDMPVASAQVKSALLLSGLYAEGPTVLREPMLSRDHTERMLVALGVPLETMASMVALAPGAVERPWPGVHWRLPADPSSAAFALVAALVCPHSQVDLDEVCTNPTRTGLLQALSLMGAKVQVEARGQLAGDEPTACWRAASSPLSATKLGGELVVRMIDEVPIFCVAAALAHGVTELRDAGELRVKESDRLAVMTTVLRAFGVEVEELPDGLRIEGPAQLKAAQVQSHGDHRIAMSAAVLALCAPGESIVDDAACIECDITSGVPKIWCNPVDRVDYL
ncbi:MAG: 3-phosphoshikimate 1-carboxyvinyltransferase, partial [Polyangiales bacterium]